MCLCVHSLSLSTDVSAPAPVCLTMEKVYDSATRLPRPEVLKEHFVKEGRLEEDVALAIIREGVCMHVRTYVVATVATLCACVVSGEHSFRVGV